jgi:ornithine carbamoyltransferase
MIKNLISLEKISVYQFSELLDLTFEIKQKPGLFKNRLAGSVIAGVFQNLSFLPNVSFQVAVASLNGKAAFFNYSDLLTKNKRLSQFSCRCLEHWMDGAVVETKNHEHIAELGKTIRIPIINAGSEKFSPCQALTDFFTIKEHSKDLTSIKLAFIGNQKNICHSLLLAAATSGTHIHIAVPRKNRPEQDVIDAAEAKGKHTQFNYRITENPQEAALNADIVYYSYIPLSSSPRIEKDFLFKESLFSSSKKDALFMFSIPFQEFKESLIKKIHPEQSLIFSQADNRLHITKAIMVSLIRNKKREI